MAYVYKHIRKDKNVVFYVGMGTDDSYSRARTKHSRNRHWKRIVAKTEYEVEIIESNLTKEEAYEKEIWYIKFYGRRDMKTGTLVNLTGGGGGFLDISEETKQHFRDLYTGISLAERLGEERAKEIGKKISEANKGKSKPKQSATMKGRYKGKENPMFGKLHTEEFKEARRQYFLKNNP